MARAFPRRNTSTGRPSASVPYRRTCRPTGTLRGKGGGRGGGHRRREVKEVEGWRGTERPKGGRGADQLRPVLEAFPRHKGEALPPVEHVGHRLGPFRDRAASPLPRPPAHDESCSSASSSICCSFSCSPLTHLLLPPPSSLIPLPSDFVPFLTFVSPWAAANLQSSASVSLKRSGGRVTPAKESRRSLD